MEGIERITVARMNACESQRAQKIRQVHGGIQGRSVRCFRQELLKRFHTSIYLLYYVDMLFLSLVSLLLVVGGCGLAWHLYRLQQRIIHLQARLALLEHAAVQRRVSRLTPTERLGESVV